MICKVCFSPCRSFGKAKLLLKFEVDYFECNNCGFIQTEEPYWLDDAYSEPVSASDVGYMSRNLYLSKITKAVIGILFDSGKRFLDYGGGHGIFVRLMRDKGLDFYLYDKYAKNIFAQYFDLDRADSKNFEVATAFEVFEHFVNPAKDIAEILKYSKNILFTTELVPEGTRIPGDWAYFGLDHGQHVSFYTFRSLELIAKRQDLKLLSNGHSIHMLTEKKMPDFLFRIICNDKVSNLLNLLLRYRSLIFHDVNMINAARKNHDKYGYKL